MEGWSAVGMNCCCNHVIMRVMTGDKVIFVCVCVLSVCWQCLSVENVECKKINGCKCMLPDGIRIDLSQLNNEAKG